MAGAEDSIEGYFRAMISIHPENLTEFAVLLGWSKVVRRECLRRRSVAELAETW
jgi:hypothetical protein